MTHASHGTRLRGLVGRAAQARGIPARQAWWAAGLALGRVGQAVALAAPLALAGCTAAGPPKPPPPPIQESIGDLGTPAPLPTAARAPGSPVAAQVPAPAAPTPPPPTPGAPGPVPTLPAIVAQAVAEAPEAPPESDAETDLPSGRELANGMIAALSRAQTARLIAKLPNGHTTDLQFVAPDRAALFERDTTGQEYARYVIIGDVGYVYDARGGSGWRWVVNEGYRKQSQIFRPMQIALATGSPLPLASGGEVERVQHEGKVALRSVFEYHSSAELQDLGLMRSTGNRLEVIVDPATWLPLYTREETETGGPEKAVTEVTFVGFDQPATVEPPVS